MMRVLLALVILVAAAGPASARQDEPGCRDHPMFSRMPNYLISDCESEEPGSFEFERAGGPVKVDGHYWQIDYWVPEGVRQPTSLQVLQYYAKLVAARGGTKLLERLDPDGALFTARIPAPKGAGTIWLQVYATMDGEIYSLTIVQERPARPSRPGTPGA